MPNVQTLPLHLLAQPLVVHIALADWVCASEMAEWVKRLRAYATAIGLNPEFGRQNIHIRRGRRAPSARDRGLIIDWLVAQHELVDVVIEPAGFDGEFLRIALRSNHLAWPVFPNLLGHDRQAQMTSAGSASTRR